MTKLKALLGGFFLGLRDEFLRWVFGYGEKPQNLIGFALAQIVGFAACYWTLRLLDPGGFWNSLYFSAVSFTALGYGSWAPEPRGWARGVGAFEAFLGILTMAALAALLLRKLVAKPY